MLTVDIVVHIVFYLACVCSNCSISSFECDRRCYTCTPAYGNIHVQWTLQNHALDIQKPTWSKTSASIGIAMVSVLHRQLAPEAGKLNPA